MPEISTAVVPLETHEITAMGVTFNASFSMGSMSVNEFDHFKELFTKGEITPEIAIDQLIAFGFGWDMTDGGLPIEITQERLKQIKPGAFILETFLGVLNTFAPKETTPSTSQPGSKRKASGAKSRESKSSAS